MGVLLSADHHLRRYAAFNTHTADGCGSRLTELLECEYFLLDLCIRSGVQYHFILGDFLDEKERLDGVVAAEAKKLCDAYQHAGIHLVLLGGNHEVAAGGLRSTLEVFGGPSCSVVLTPQELVVDQTQYVLLPHTDNVKQQMEWVQQIAQWPRRNGKARILCAHVMVDGARSGSEYALRGHLTLEDFGPSWDAMWFGHVHEPQMLSPIAGYIGSLAQRNFSDEGTNRHVVLYRNGVQSKRLVHVPGPVFRTLPAAQVSAVADAQTQQSAPMYLKVLSDTMTDIKSLRAKLCAGFIRGFAIVGPSEQGAADVSSRTHDTAVGWREAIPEYVQACGIVDEDQIGPITDLGLELLDAV